MFYEYDLRRFSESKIKELSFLFIRETSTGVYFVEKDRFEEMTDKYIDSHKLSTLLCHYDKVSILPLHKNLIYSNYEYNKRYALK